MGKRKRPEDPRRLRVPPTRGERRKDPDRDRYYLMSVGRGRAYVGPAIQAKEREFAESIRLMREDPSHHMHRCSTCNAWFPHRETAHAGHRVLPCVLCASPRERARLLQEYLGGALADAILARDLARCRPSEKPAGESVDREGTGQWFELPLETLIRLRGPEVLLDCRPWWAILELSRAAKLMFKVEGPAIDAARAGLTEKSGMAESARDARAKLQRIFRALTALPRRRPARTFSDEKILLRLRALTSDGLSRAEAVSRLEEEVGKKRLAIEQALSRAKRSEK